MIAGIEDRGVLGEADAVLSGYQGDPAVGAVILDAVARVKAAEPGRGLLLRPGDGRRRPRHVRAPGHPGVHARHRRARGPTSSPPTTSSSTSWPAAPRPRSTRCWRRSTWSATADRATYWSPACCTTTLPEDSLDVVAVSDEGAWAVTTPLLPITPERRRRRHRGALPRAPARDRLRPRGAGADHRVGVRGAGGDDRRRHPRDRAGRRAGRHRTATGYGRGTTPALSRHVRHPRLGRTR